MKWIVRFFEWLLELFSSPDVIPEPFKVPEIPVDSGLPATLPGVQMVTPPAEYFGALSKAIDNFAAATLEPGDKGGLVGIVVRKPDGSINMNLAIVQRLGKRTTVTGWIGKSGSWGSPVEGGVAFKTRW